MNSEEITLHFRYKVSEVDINKINRNSHLCITVMSNN